MKKIITMYARSHCTENGHYFLEQKLREYCSKHQISLHYYRKLKIGHLPMWREWKLTGLRGKILKLAEVFKEDINNEWRQEK